LFYLSYALAELRRRKGRTLLTALGLAIGVGLVVTVSALSQGLDDAQDKVLEPLTGVGTDMSVTRPLKVSGEGGNANFRVAPAPGSGPPPGGPGGLSSSEQRRLQQENGAPRFGLQRLGKPGEHFSNDRLMSTAQLSFPEGKVAQIAKLDGAKDAAGALTLANTHISGTVPKQASTNRPQAGVAPGPPRSINADSSSVNGIDESKPSLAPVTPSQVTSGRYLSTSGGKREALLNVGYARRKGYSLDDKVTVGGKKFKVVGITSAPLGGSASDIYVKLATLQKLSDRKGRVNTVQVRANSTADVGKLEQQISESFPGSEVTTAKDLADRIGGSLKDAKNLSQDLGTALSIVALVAAFLIASLLTLSSVAKRTRELGTLKAIGWPQRLVVRQVTGETLAQGLLGGIAGAVVGIAGAAIISLIGPTLEATVAATPQALGPFGFGQTQVASGSSHVDVGAPIDVTLILLAIGLALLGGLIAGAVGSLRASRLRPAEALRSVE
jgi:ABC-type antimicrobial peptide transport system permease subunit